MKNAYLICPVRKLTDTERKEIDSKIVELRKGYNLYIPYEKKQDCDGKEICERNRRAIIKADIVFVWWNAISEGSVFDFGMFYALNKPVIVINKINRTEHKSFSNVLDDIRIK